MVRFSIRRWAAWAPGLETHGDWLSWARGDLAAAEFRPPPLNGVDPMLRRRAGPLGRFALEPLLAVKPAGMPVVFCSRHGEAQRSVALLRSLAAGEPLSPTEFSLSVHNAVAGLYSVARTVHEPLTAVAGGPVSAIQGLIEAVAQLDDHTEEVALVVYDIPLPPPYDRFRDEHELPFGWAWVISNPEPGHCTLDWDSVSRTDEAVPLEPFGLALLRAYLLGGAHRIVRDGVAWHWCRHG